jgi:hypothetical protein
LVEGEPEDRETLLSRLRAFRPGGGKTDVNVTGMPHIELKGDVHVLDLSKATNFLSTKKVKFQYSKRFILIHEVLITFVPLISFGDKYSAFKMGLVDNRKLDNPVVRSYMGNTNISCNASASLDYCICVDDISDMSLVFVCPQPTLKDGKTWAVVNVNLSLRQLDFPVQTYVKPTFAIFQIPHSGLADNEVDPRHFHGTLQEADLEALKTIKAQGDLSDVSKPVVKTMAKSALAGTSYSGAGKKLKSALKNNMNPMFNDDDRVDDKKSNASSDSGYLPEKDGYDQADESPHITRMKESALKFQRELQEKMEESNNDQQEPKSDSLKSSSHSAEQSHSVTSIKKKNTRFANLVPSVDHNQGDEDLEELKP